MTSRKETSCYKLSFDFPVWGKTKENTDRQTFLKVYISRLDVSNVSRLNEECAFDSGILANNIDGEEIP